MHFFNNSAFNNHEQVSFFYDQATGLKAIIAIHNTNLGPALGGCRMWDYASDEEALYDVLRLSQGMTYKAALAGLPLGGGKSIIMGNPKTMKSAELMKSMGKAVESLGGKYIIAEDVGIGVEDMNQMSETCSYATGLLKNNQGSGDPSPVTAHGVFVGIKSATQYRLQREDLRGMKVAVQGLGHVGFHLCQLLHNEGAVLFVTDVDQEKIEMAVQEFGATPVGLDEIYDVDADIFSPCALGAVINDKTINRLKMKIVAGASNNQLAEVRHGQMLAERGILYAPDYAINVGGLISVYYEYAARYQGIEFSRENVFAHTNKLKATLENIFSYAEQHKISTAAAADIIAEQLFQR
jgi:leucine dehydrogenase